MSKLGDFIETVRKNKRITIRKLAEKMGKSAAYICDIEKGNRKPNDSNFFAEMADALEIEGEERAQFFDLVADPEKSEAPKDIADYVNEVPEARAALRVAKEKATAKYWEEFRQMLERKRR